MHESAIAFLQKHKAACANVVSDLCKPSKLEQNLSDKFFEWKAENHETITAIAIEEQRSLTQKFAELVIRCEGPKAKSKLKTLRTQEAKREKAVEEAYSRYENMHTNDADSHHEA